MAPPHIQYIGWDPDFRYAEERRRVTEQIQAIAMEKGFAYALVQDMMIRCRYRSFGLHVTINFKTEEWVAKGIPKHVPVRLYFNEDCDLSDRVPNPEWFPEADESEEQ